MFTPPVTLIDHRGRAALAFSEPEDVVVEREQFEAVAALIPVTGRSWAMQAALDSLDWADSTSCEICTARPVVTKDRRGPLCADCAEFRARESVRVRAVFKAAGLGGDCQ